MPITDAMRDAARRMSDVLVYGVHAEWRLTEMGLELRAQYGAESVTRCVAYDDFSRARSPGDLLIRTERAALDGLSN